MALGALAAWIGGIASPAGAIDRGADGEFSKRSSMHFELLQDVDIDRDAPRRRFERQVVEVLESAYRRVGDELGLRPGRKQTAIVYDPRVFDARFGQLFGFRAAGFYDRAIHVRGAVAVDARLAGTLFHEYTHAALAYEATGWSLPGWVNEGLAEWFEGLAVGRRGLTRGQRALLAEALRRGTLPSLATLEGPTFAQLGAHDAGLAYLVSYAAIDHLDRRKRDGLRRFVETLLRTRSPSVALRRVHGLDLAELEEELASDLGR